MPRQSEYKSLYMVSNIGRFRYILAILLSGFEVPDIILTLTIGWYWGRYDRWDWYWEVDMDDTDTKTIGQYR